MKQNHRIGSRVDAMTPRRGWKRIDVIVLVAIVVTLVGLVLPAIHKVRCAAHRTMNVNNLKCIGLAMHTHNDTFYCLPNNGGADDTETLEKVNYGWHNPKYRFSGTWATQIMPWFTNRPFPRFGAKGVEPPSLLPEYPANDQWQIEIPELLCAERARSPFKNSRAPGCYPGPVTDFAINIFFNSTPHKFENPMKGFCRAGKDPTRNGDWAAYQSKRHLNGIMDGPSNTILAGQKAVPPELYRSDEARDGDEGIFSPGNWSLKDGKKTLVSTGTGRGHNVVAKPPVGDQKEYPPGGGVPWMYRDSELRGDGAKLPYQLAWGSPFKEGVQFVFGDGAVRTFNYSQRGTIFFAHLLYPNDGADAFFEPDE